MITLSASRQSCATWLRHHQEAAGPDLGPRVCLRRTMDGHVFAYHGARADPHARARAGSNLGPAGRRRRRRTGARRRPRPATQCRVTIACACMTQPAPRCAPSSTMAVGWMVTATKAPRGGNTAPVRYLTTARRSNPSGPGRSLPPVLGRYRLLRSGMSSQRHHGTIHSVAGIRRNAHASPPQVAPDHDDRGRHRIDRRRTRASARSRVAGQLERRHRPRLGLGRRGGRLPAIVCLRRFVQRRRPPRPITSRTETTERHRARTRLDLEALPGRRYCPARRRPGRTR